MTPTTEELDALVKRLRGSIYGEMYTRHLRDEAADAITALRGNIYGEMYTRHLRDEAADAITALRGELLNVFRDGLLGNPPKYVTWDEFASMRAENAALAKDAGRYRRWRAQPQLAHKTDAEIDAIFDAAIGEPWWK